MSEKLSRKREAVVAAENVLKANHTMPEGLTALLENMSRQVILHNPKDTHAFLATYLEGLVGIRDGHLPCYSGDVQAAQEAMNFLQDKLGSEMQAQAQPEQQFELQYSGGPKEVLRASQDAHSPVSQFADTGSALPAECVWGPDAQNHDAYLKGATGAGAAGQDGFQPVAFREERNTLSPTSPGAPNLSATAGQPIGNAQPETQYSGGPNEVNRASPDGQPPISPQYAGSAVPAECVWGPNAHKYDGDYLKGANGAEPRPTQPGYQQAVPEGKSTIQPISSTQITAPHNPAVMGPQPLSGNGTGNGQYEAGVAGGEATNKLQPELVSEACKEIPFAQTATPNSAVIGAGALHSPSSGAGSDIRQYEVEVAGPGDGALSKSPPSPDHVEPAPVQTGDHLGGGRTIPSSFAASPTRVIGGEQHEPGAGAPTVQEGGDFTGAVREFVLNRVKSMRQVFSSDVPLQEARNHILTLAVSSFVGLVLAYALVRSLGVIGDRNGGRRRTSGSMACGGSAMAGRLQIVDILGERGRGAVPDLALGRCSKLSIRH